VDFRNGRPKWEAAHEKRLIGVRIKWPHQCNLLETEGKGRGRRFGEQLAW